MNTIVQREFAVGFLMAMAASLGSVFSSGQFHNLAEIPDITYAASVMLSLANALKMVQSRNAEPPCSTKP